MKRYLVSLVFMMLAILTGSTLAAEPDKCCSSLEQGEMNLLKSLESSNYGVRTSAAAILGDIKSTKAVIPLMRMLKSSDDEKTRIVAALALFKIGDSMGLFTISRAATFDESPRVRRLCANFYNEYYVKELNESRTDTTYAVK